MDFYQAWQFLTSHPAFNIDEDDESPCYLKKFQDTLRYMMVVKVDPSTETKEDDESRNTATRVWLECGPWRPTRPGDPFFPDRKCTPTHDWRLDCGAPTFEEAIIE